MRIAVVAWHGLGDLVMLTAPLKQYAELHPADEINLFTLKRFGSTSVELLSGLPFIKSIYPILPDAWNDFPSYQEGISGVLNFSKIYAKNLGFDAILPTMCSRESMNEFSIFNNKMFRFAFDFNIKYTKRSQTKPTLTVSDEARKEVKEFLKKYPGPHVVMHIQAGNSKKTLTYNHGSLISYPWENFSTFEIGENIEPMCDKHISLGLPPMEFTKALIDLCDYVIAIDSVVMHIAFALEKNIKAIFTSTPVIQVVPLWKDYSSFVDFCCIPSECGQGLDVVQNLKDV